MNERNISIKDFLFQSYNEFASYLCREVFTDMSVLPLVFPSNISCFSRGSYKVMRHCVVLLSGNIMTGETYVTLCHTFVTCHVFQEELARTRELPVPPQPRRSGVLARSDDNLTGEAPYY